MNLAGYTFVRCEIFYTDALDRSMDSPQHSPLLQCRFVNAVYSIGPLLSHAGGVTLLQPRSQFRSFFQLQFLQELLLRFTSQAAYEFIPRVALLELGTAPIAFFL